MTRLRILGIAWIVAALPVGLFGTIMVGLSEDVVGAGAGIILIVLAGLALAVGTALRGVDPNRRIRASLAVSGLWVVGSLFTTLSMDFAADRWLAGGVPAAIGVLTAALALSAWRARSPGRPSAVGAADPDEPRR
jgi:hypothetical protein